MTSRQKPYLAKPGAKADTAHDGPDADELGLRQITPAEVIAPGAGDPRLLTRSMVRSNASAADLAPPPARHGSLAGLEHPSRMGNRLHYRDGRVTDLHGKAIAS